MDNNKQAVIAEFFKLVFGIGIIMANGDWFGISSYATIAPYCIVLYLIGSFLTTIYISKKQQVSIPNIAF
jgi:4-hydroxybenzoate polyprenyltransferase